MEPDLNQETIDEPTPNGGMKSIAYFFDSNGKPTPKRDATKCEIHELDNKDKVIFRSYLNLKPMRS